MTVLDQFLEAYIFGTTHEWYHRFEALGHPIEQGFFHKKADCRASLRRTLRQIITDESVLLDYLILKANHNAQRPE